MDEYLVGAFCYSDENASIKAQNEQNKIMKLEAQMDYNNPKVVYSVYCKLIEKSVFETLEGVTYLLHLQSYLDNNADILSGPIPSIPARLLEKSLIFSPVQNNDENASADEGAVEQSAENQNDNEEDRNAEKTSVNWTTRADNEKMLKRKINTATFSYKIVIGFLIVLIGIMLFITIKSDSPNIINYRSKIENEYVEWEQKLKDKEKELKKREKELGMDKDSEALDE